jgi:ankyrin repeat protein
VLLLGRGIDVDSQGQQGFTPLHLACQEGAISAARALLDGGASIDRPNSFEDTPLFVVVGNSRGRGDLIQLLRERGAYPDAENRYSQTPVGFARLIANFDLAQYFSDLPD